MHMKRLLPIAGIVCCAAPAACAQTAAQGSAAADAFVAALNAGDPKLLRPFLADRCSVPGLAPAQFAAVLSNVITGWTRRIARHSCEMRAEGGMELTIVCADGGVAKYETRLDADGRFVELGLIRVEATPQEPAPPIAFAGPDAVRVPLVPYGDLWAIRARADGVEGLWLIDSGAPMLVLNGTAGRDPGSGRWTALLTTSVSGATVPADQVLLRELDLQGQVARGVKA